MLAEGLEKMADVHFLSPNEQLSISHLAGAEASQPLHTAPSEKGPAALFRPPGSSLHVGGESGRPRVDLCTDPPSTGPKDGHQLFCYQSAVFLAEPGNSQGVFLLKIFFYSLREKQGGGRKEKD